MRRSERGRTSWETSGATTATPAATRTATTTPRRSVRSPSNRTLSTGAVKHINFWDLINSIAMQPQLHGPRELNVDTLSPYKVKIRPCWPYTDQVTYQLNWGDGSA